MKITRMKVGGFAANCYLLMDEETKEAAVIDPGSCPGKIVSALEGYHVKYILLTHAHFEDVYKRQIQRCGGHRRAGGAAQTGDSGGGSVCNRDGCAAGAAFLSGGGYLCPVGGADKAAAL